MITKYTEFANTPSPLLDAPVAPLRRGDALRWIEAMRMLSASLEDNQFPELSRQIWFIMGEVKALLEDE